MKILYIMLLTLLITACTSSTVEQLQPGVVLPANYRETFIHYATVDRADGVTRDIFINPEAIRDYFAGRLPENTVIVIEAYQAGKGEDKQYHINEQNHLVQDHPLEMIHVMEKRSTWTESDFPTSNRTGQWNFGSFDFATGERFEEDMGACFNCHNAAHDTEFMYSGNLLRQYIMTGEKQYFYCNLSGRIAC